MYDIVIIHYFSEGIIYWRCAVGVLGKDLFRLDKNHFSFTVLFSVHGYEIEGRGYRYGELLTAFLNYDASEFSELTYAFARVLGAKPLNTLYGKIIKCMRKMPPYETLGDMLDLEFLTLATQYGEGIDINKEKLQELAADISFVQNRYTWMLQEMQKTQNGKKADPCAGQLMKCHLEPTISGRSLGACPRRDPPRVEVQYEVRDSVQDGQARVFEKMEFSRLLDFLYVELCKGMMQDNHPKQCKNCGRWFLKERSSTYEYCGGIAPGEKDRTCREVGARASFSDKVKNNEVWQLHQRAYKKYYARVLKKNMTKADFNTWALRAEKLRDEALKEFEETQRRGERFDLAEFSRRLNGG